MILPLTTKSPPMFALFPTDKSLSIVVLLSTFKSFPTFKFVPIEPVPVTDKLPVDVKLPVTV